MTYNVFGGTLNLAQSMVARAPTAVKHVITGSLWLVDYKFVGVCRFVSVADLWEPSDDGTASQVSVLPCFPNLTYPTDNSIND